MNVIRNEVNNIKAYMSKKGFVNIACNLVNDIVYEIELIYTDLTTENLQKIMRFSQKLEHYMKGNFEELWEMELHDSTDLSLKYPGLSL